MWSYPFASVIVLALALLVVTTVFSLKVVTRSGAAEPVGLRQMSVDIALLLWGVSYFVSTVDDPVNGGRITDLDLFGSQSILTAALDWFALSVAILAVLSWTFSRLNGVDVRVLLLVGTTTTSLLILEGAARVKAFAFPATHGFPTHSSEIWSRRFVLLNDDGFRGTDFVSSSSTPTRRLLTLIANKRHRV